MASNFYPFRTQEILQLPTKDLAINDVTLDNDRFICLRQKQGNEILIVDMKGNSSRFLCNTLASFAIFNPTLDVVAIKADKTLQLLNLEGKTLIKSYKLRNDVMFWKWISPNTIGVITKTAVYNFSVEGAIEPRRMLRFRLNPYFLIKDYQIDPKKKWLLFVYINTLASPKMSVVELVSVEFNVYRGFKCHAATFAQVKLKENIEPSIFLCLVVRNETGGKVHILDIGVIPQEERPFPKTTTNLTFLAEAYDDLPIAVHASNIYDIIYVVTRQGYVHIYDIESGVCIYIHRVSTEPILVSVLDKSTGGVLAVDNNGKVISYTINADTIVPYIAQKFGDASLTDRFARSIELGRAKGLLLKKLTNLEPKSQQKVATKLLRNKSGQLSSNAGPVGNGGTTGLKADQLYSCAKNNDHCGCKRKSNGICEPTDGSSCAHTFEKLFEPLLLESTPNPTPSAPFLEDVESPELTTNLDDAKVDREICVICFEERKSHALAPCGHFSFCEGCANNVTECPICRAAVTSRMKIFQA